MNTEPPPEGEVPRGHEEIYHLLRERISLLVYPPGTMLSENALAQEFGVSRTPIRRVLHRLEFDGLVTARHGVGTFVTPVDLMHFKQVYALRLKLLDLIAELPPSHIPEEAPALLDDLLDRAHALRGRRDIPALARLHLRFDEVVSDTIGNRPLREITERLFHQATRVWLELLPELDWAAEVDAFRDEIEGVARALRQEDMHEVAAVRRRHLIDSVRRINQCLGGSLEPTLEERP